MLTQHTAAGLVFRWGAAKLVFRRWDHKRASVPRPQALLDLAGGPVCRGVHGSERIIGRVGLLCARGDERIELAPQVRVLETAAEPLEVALAHHHGDGVGRAAPQGARFPMDLSLLGFRSRLGWCGGSVGRLNRDRLKHALHTNEERIHFERAT